MKRKILKKTPYRLNDQVRLWVKAEQPDDESDAAETCFERWYATRENGANTIKMSRYVYVDRALLQARFSCVPYECSPGIDQGKWRCCCADIHVPLTSGEIRKLGRSSEGLGRFLMKNEPRLIRSISNSNGTRKSMFWLDEDGTSLSQPSGRCVFSTWDRLGRLRCHLHAYTKKINIALNDVQPYTCRIFPLLVIQMEYGRILVTVLNRENYRAWETLAPHRFPCLSNPDHPPIVRSMANTLDWLFGDGFALDLEQEAEKEGIAP